MLKRSNEEWMSDLVTLPQRADALGDLRKILVHGLRRGLVDQVNTSAPEFDALAEDFAQEALMKILDNLHTFAGRSQFTTWAHKIALAVALTELRRKRWQDRSLSSLTETEHGEYTPLIIADPAPEPSNATERADVLSRVNRIIAEELTEKQRAALTAVIIDELPTPQVATLLDMKPNAVYKLVHDARLRLKKRLISEGLTPEDVLEAFN